MCNFQKIERQWTIIREEAAAIWNNQPYLFEAEHEELTVAGKWLAYPLYSSNLWNSSNCLKAPKTCDIMRVFENSSNCLKSEVSVVMTNVRIQLYFLN